MDQGLLMRMDTVRPTLMRGITSTLRAGHSNPTTEARIISRHTRITTVAWRRMIKIMLHLADHVVRAPSIWGVQRASNTRALKAASGKKRAIRLRRRRNYVFMPYNCCLLIPFTSVYPMTRCRRSLSAMIPFSVACATIFSFISFFLCCPCGCLLRGISVVYFDT